MIRRFTCRSTCNNNAFSSSGSASPQQRCSHRTGYAVRAGDRDPFFFPWWFRKGCLYFIAIALPYHTMFSPKYRHFMAERRENAQRYYDEFDERYGYVKEVAAPDKEEETSERRRK